MTTSRILRQRGRRARTQDARDQRRADILAAAAGLLDLKDGDLPAVARIARASRVAKGTPYLYFRTKEQIYLAVLAEGFGRWLACSKESLEAEPPSLEKFVDNYCRFCDENPSVLYLAARSGLVLERNIDDQTARRFKDALAREVEAIGRRIAERIPGYTVAQAATLFLYSYALTVGLWQYAHPPPAIARVLRDEGMAVLRLDFSSALRSALLALWRGSTSRVGGGKTRRSRRRVDQGKRR